MSGFAREVPADEWGDESTCPNCGGNEVVEFGYRVGGQAPRKTSLECRDCGTYSGWRDHG